MSETFAPPATQSSSQHQTEELRERASKDTLSGLLNRAAAEQYIQIRLQTMVPGERCALFVVDLDDFKQGSGTPGHPAGDEAIRRAAQILSRWFRAADIVGRLDGDRFVVFSTGSITEQLVREKTAGICRALQRTLNRNPKAERAARVGVYIAAGNSKSFEDLFRSAELALCRANEAGTRGFCILCSEGVPEGERNLRPVNTVPLTRLLEDMDSGAALLEMGGPMDLIYVTPGFCRLLGVELRAVALPRPLEEFVHPDDLPDLEQALREVLEQDRPAKHTLRMSPDGKNWTCRRMWTVPLQCGVPRAGMLVIATGISSCREDGPRLQEIEHRLQAALAQTAYCLWEVDLPSRQIRVFDPQGRFGLPGKESVAFPAALLDSGWIHPDSALQFQEFADTLLAGQAQGCGTFSVRRLDTGSCGWAALSYCMLFDEEGHAAKAVGLLESVLQNFTGQEVRSILKRPLPEGQIPDLMAALRANLSRDSMQELWLEGRDQSAPARELTATQALQRAAEQLLSPEDRAQFAPYFDRAQLLQAFADGRRWLWAEYPRADGAGGAHWVSYMANLAQDPLTREVYLFLYLSRLDRRRRWEKQAESEIRRDPVTHLYERGSARALVEALLERRRPGSCAVALICLDGLMERYAGDPELLDQKRGCVGMALAAALGNQCVLGQYSADQIVAFFPEVRSKRELRSHLEEAFSFARLTLAGAVDLEALRFVAGVVCEPAQEAGYGAMAAQASSLCQLRRGAAADAIVFPRQDDDWAWAELQTARKEDQITVHQSEMDRPLSEGEKDVAFRCMSAMLAADSLGTSIRSVLNYIGTYYRADRVYVLTLSEDQRVINMPFEWTNTKKHSIQQVVSGAQVEHFSLLKRCMEERAPVFLTRTQPISLQGERAAGEPWYFTAFPLMDRELFRGFLCVENSREHPADAALFSTLIPYILRERARFQYQERRAEDAPASKLLGLPNLRSYMEVIFTLTSDRYHSMGAVCVDIPNLPILNSSLGFEYGSRLLWFVSKTMADLFGPNWIFRTWDAEFVALCPDTARSVFEGRCARLRTALQQRCPKEVRMGRAWADGHFQAKNLVSEARDLLRAEPAEDPLPTAQILLGHSRYQSVGEAARGGRFPVFYQPKIDLTTGALCGAEALVRGLDDDGRLILPDQFLGELENRGSIRELDLFVLEQALAQADQWREQGLGIVPVSVNFSRVTLFHPTALASVLAIQSRYPALPPDTLELEIPERAGTMGASHVQAVIDPFRQCGIRISLDHFGSKYTDLSLFTNVTVDAVKLDRSLMADLPRDPVNRMLLQDMIRLCRTCGIPCMADGVEHQRQLDILRNAGCRCAQGNYYDRPLSAEAFAEKYLRGRGPGGPIT